MSFDFLGAAVVFAFCALLLKTLGFRGAPVFVALALSVMAIEIISRISSPLRSVISVLNESGASDIAVTAFKILGIGYLFGICTDICKELGEPNIAKFLEICGRVEIMTLVLPFLIEIIEMGAELL